MFSDHDDRTVTSYEDQGYGDRGGYRGRGGRGSRRPYRGGSNPYKWTRGGGSGSTLFQQVEMEKLFLDKKKMRIFVSLSELYHSFGSFQEECKTIWIGCDRHAVRLAAGAAAGTGEGEAGRGAAGAAAATESTRSPVSRTTRATLIWMERVAGAVVGVLVDWLSFEVLSGSCRHTDATPSNLRVVEYDNYFLFRKFESFVVQMSLF